MELVEQAIKKIEIGNVEEGLSELSSIAKTADHETKYEIAGLYYELGHMNKAKKIVEELLFFYPDEGYLYAFLAELLIDLNEEDQAIEYLLEIKEDDSAYLQAQL